MNRGITKRYPSHRDPHTSYKRNQTLPISLWHTAIANHFSTKCGLWKRIGLVLKKQTGVNESINHKGNTCDVPVICVQWLINSHLKLTLWHGMKFMAHITGPETWRSRYLQNIQNGVPIRTNVAIKHDWVRNEKHLGSRGKRGTLLASLSKWPTTDK